MSQNNLMTPQALLELANISSGDDSRPSTLRPESLELSNQKPWHINSGSSETFLMRKKKLLDE
jgi:hypothetical protein